MALTLLMQTGCSNSHDSAAQNGSGTAESFVINLNLTVPSPSVGTRGENDYDELVAGTPAESYIDIDNEDYQILIFDGDGNYAGDKLSEIKCVENGVKGGAASYTLTATLTLSDEEDMKNLSKFRMMVLANWKSFERSNTNTTFDYPSFSGYTLPEGSNNIYQDKENLNFKLAERNSEPSWVPSIGDKAIPMFGVTEELDLQFVSDMGRYGDAASFSVPMLRSLAKIEIVDMVPGDGAQIESCVLTKYNSSGRFIPDIENEKNSEWFKPEIQIGAPSLPEGVGTYTNLQFAETTKFAKPEGATEDEARPCFVVYVPEMAIDPSTAPTITVKLEGSEQEYTIELADYENGKVSTKFTSLLRNHNYRFDIVDVGSTELDFIIQTPWQNKSAGEWEYEDIKIGFESDKEFSWDFSNYDEETKLPKFEGGDILNPRTVIITQDDWLEGTFKLTSPSQAKWTISLYGDDNTLNDHFNVETGSIRHETDMNGESYDVKEWNPGGPSVSGNVGEEVLFRIIPSAVNNSNEHYVARVVLTCTTFDDQLIEVNLPYFYDENYNVEGSEMPMPTLGNNGYYYVKQYYSGFKDLDDNEPERPDNMDGDDTEEGD